MTADHLSYRRATSVSVIGLLIQTLLAAMILIYARLEGDSAAMTGALLMMLGIPVWGSLALVFHQHRLERLEALENEAYAGSAAARASVFGEATFADNQAQAQKLAWMHRWFLPSVSLVVGATMVGLGILRFTQSRGLLNPEATFVPPSEHGWAISLGVGVAVVGFIFARFVAGMAQQKVWRLLHAGSASAVAAALVGVSLALAHFLVVAAREPVLLRYLAPAIALVMVGLGAEIFLNFVLNLYRPRKVGEYQRPAFDSRILSFIAAPDRLAESISEAINYQFGFNVSATWFYQLMARSVLSLLLLGTLVIWGMSIFKIVAPHERALLVRNGALVREIGPGMTIDLPWPFASVVRFPSQAVNTLQMGTPKPNQEGPILWTNEHNTAEKFTLVQALESADPTSGDLNLLAIEMPVVYTVRDLEKYKRLAQDGPSDRIEETRQNLLSAVARRVAMKHLATMTVAQVLGPERARTHEKLRTLVQSEFDQTLDAGVDVIFAGIVGAHPEQSVAPAFEEVVRADQRRLTAIEKARADAIRALASVVGDVDRARSIIASLDDLDRLKNAKAPREEIVKKELEVNESIALAGGEAAQLVSEARADRWRKHIAARSLAASREGLTAAYNAAPLAFRVDRYLAALREGLADRRVQIVPTGPLRLRINLEEAEPIVSGFGPDEADDAPPQ